ncbi:hypothetical protein F8B62_01320 [Salmonella enterica subsp. enterica serovar Schwarzengrund]|nr:hypothetical protein F8B62_01320 [Salmonella enterica subsp. enterica serovar Schwarzengrund]
MVVFYKNIRSEGKKSTERKSDKYGMDKARWHQDVQAVKKAHLQSINHGFCFFPGQNIDSILRKRREEYVFFFVFYISSHPRQTPRYRVVSLLWTK